MHTIVPLAGPDLIMKNGGFKPLHIIDNQPSITKVLKSRPWYKKENPFIFIVRDVNGISQLVNFLNNNFENCQVVLIPSITNGALLSSLSGVGLIKHYLAPICVDLADILYSCNLDPVRMFQEDLDLYGIIPSFNSSDPKFSYLEVKNNTVVKTKEKSVISTIASSGTYFFNRLSSFLEAVAWSLNNEQAISYKNNLFLCPSYNFFASRGMKVKHYPVDNVQCVNAGL